ncbi:MAG: hypothetical protein BroJett033_9030 [Chloroflexota bacterium]|nr:MAG: hypothetical protein BroJett033_9030 [Chloroflexota bacterium]
MLGDQLTDERLSDAQLDIFRQHARRRLVRGGYNLFAEITLRVLQSHDVQAREIERLRRSQAAHRDRDLEAELLARENDALRLHLRDLEIERRRLLEQVRQQEQEIAALKRYTLRLPPSWEKE